MFELPFWSDSAGRARAILRSWLIPFCVVDDRIEDAALILAELIANAIRHATPGPTNRVCVELTVVWEILHIAVSDGGSDFYTPQIRPESTEVINGRGLRLVADVADDWWWEQTTDGGRKVHATISMHGTETRT